MNGFLARVVERTLGSGAPLRPVTNRWSISSARDLPLEISSGAEPTRALPSQQRRDARNDTARSATVHADDAHLVSSRVDVDVAIPVIPSRGRLQSADGRATEVTNRVDAPVILSEAPKARSRRTDGTYGADRPLESDRDLARPETGLDRAPRLLPQQAAPAIAARPAATGARETVARAPEPAPVYVHIGRIDVRAVDAPVPKSTPAHPVLRGPSLEAHLRSRDRGTT